MIWLALLVACRPDGEPSECTAERPCDWGSICIEGTCVAGSCSTSAQCPIENFCYQGQCFEGCRADTDCPFGEHCELELGECVADRCEDTRVDCGFAQYCDTTTGTCFDAGEQFCRPCERDVQCGEGNLCFNNYCGVDCNDRDCPSGFDCLTIGDDFGNITAFQCVGPCGTAL